MWKRRLSKKVGVPPGTLVYTGEKEEEFELSLITYSPDSYSERNLERVEELMPFKDTQTVTWIRVVGLHRVEQIEKLGELFGIHPLTLEDILNVHQRPKIEFFEDYIFVVMRTLSYEKGMKSEQISLVLGRNFLISFQERKSDIFKPVETRLRNNKGSIRKKGADYLLYSFLDIVVDSYFVLLETLGEVIDTLEDEVLSEPYPHIVKDIHLLKRDLNYAFKVFWTTRDEMNRLLREDSSLIRKRSLIYYRDVYDHIIRVIDITETMRDTVSGLLDVYFSSVSNRMNEIMKVLTIIATVFIPLTFIAGVYGMNFKYMPELEWKYGYPAVLLFMLLIGMGLLFFFRRKRWL
ncbi:magnesium/cobalt transporter CorA [Hydrogenivirga caldilitoris]|uniref:magnesium/cobalt transporter CorA n=1 Tax=Hydrogenivirga caldilitoris TaxID=246264 RepID=UPI0014748745